MTDMLRIEDSGGVLAVEHSQVPAGWEGEAPDHEAADHGYYVIERPARGAAHRGQCG
jgi:hypothetical protein